MQDATVSYPDLDFRFTNNSDSPIRIEAALQGKKVVCTILKLNPASD
ncbi:VanW family protein [Effusibacillus pohliae]